VAFLTAEFGKTGTAQCAQTVLSAMIKVTTLLKSPHCNSKIGKSQEIVLT
jgi:hypothetical protein